METACPDLHHTDEIFRLTKLKDKCESRLRKTRALTSQKGTHYEQVDQEQENGFIARLGFGGFVRWCFGFWTMPELSRFDVAVIIAAYVALAAGVYWITVIFLIVIAFTISCGFGLYLEGEDKKELNQELD
jgi:hypothetical protein